MTSCTCDHCLRHRRPQFRLLGFGLDAIVQATSRPRTWFERLLNLKAPHDSRMPVVPTNRDRLLRYQEARCFFGTNESARMFELRVEMGTQYLNAWKRGRTPNFDRIRRIVSRGSHLRAVS